LVVAAAALAALGLSGEFARAGGADAWHRAAKRLGYPIYRPTNTLGFRMNAFSYGPCTPKPYISATYGTYRGDLLSKTRGFGLLEGSPVICSNAADWVSLGTVRIGRNRAALGVYCSTPTGCSKKDGVANGFSLTWDVPYGPGGRKRTSMFMDSSHLGLADFLRVARNLARAR
jgi:hypothetical protein